MKDNFCSCCGLKLDNSASFCSNCGAAVETDRSIGEVNFEQFPSEVEPEIVSELVTINDAVRYVTSYLIEQEVFLGHGTDSYWDEAMYLVMCCINLDPPADRDTLTARLTMREKRNIAKALELRVKKRLPVAYITNRAWFCGIEFYVDKRVIIPRSPIGEMIKNNFAPYMDHEPRQILDMCTGSGCIALACANQFQNATIDAVDLSLDALEVCAQNIYRYGMEDVVYPIQSDLFNELPNDTEYGYDLIICNPPYVDKADLDDMPAEFHHEPRMALEAGDDGLDLVKVILGTARDYMSQDGILVVEVGNSYLHLEEQFPEVSFNWVEFQNGGSGVFVMTAQELEDYQEYFAEFRREL